MQATEKITELTEERKKLEKEQGKLLATNVEMAIETKRLLLLQKEWKQEKVDLLAANSEFAEEVERLYKAEEKWDEEKEEAKKEAEAARAGLQQELVELGREVESLQLWWQGSSTVFRSVSQSCSCCCCWDEGELTLFSLLGSDLASKQ